MATRWGIVSAGKISHDFVSAVRSLPEEEHKFVAVAARNLDNAKEFASLHNIPKAYGSYEDLAKDDSVEVVYVGTVNSHHFSIGKMMLEAKKHVLMEKPMTLNLKQTKELINIAKKNNCFLMEAMWSRFLPVYKQLSEELSKKTIGDVLHVSANFGIPASHIERLTKKSLGGGTVLDLGIYTINAACVVYQDEKLQKIAAVGHCNEDGVDLGISASLLYDNGCMATIVTSCLGKLPCDLIVSGTKGQLKIPDNFWCGTKLITPNKTYEFVLPDTAVPCNFTNSSGLRYEAMEVRECLKKGLLESPTMKHSDSELLASIMDEIRRQVGVVYPEDG